MEVLINAATSADGKISNRRREQVRISSDEDFERVDRLRAESDGIMVGVGTVLSDDPSLTCDGEGENPTRVVADSRARTPTDASLFDAEGEVVVGVGGDAPAERVEALSERATVVETSGERVALDELFAYLEDDGVETLMVEGGGELNFSLIDAGLVDRMLVYVGATVIGGRDAPTLVDGDGFVDGYPALRLESVECVGEGALFDWRFQA